MKKYIRTYVCRACGEYVPCMFTEVMTSIEPAHHPQQCPLEYRTPKWKKYIEPVEALQ